MQRTTGCQAETSPEDEGPRKAICVSEVVGVREHQGTMLFVSRHRQHKQAESPSLKYAPAIHPRAVRNQLFR